ncbi:outer membrane beta-barrel protein [Opitutus terrae]|uniref:Uncharacterized protein n=1 Tax=Opitutus terrae (strain DSM 11246 / JCM 15787 / PB90-1) TaxID=452637 RepID=B1ZQ68_OPITP|nr:outer membrane beta-barrel protein [Opitutus terrae]ACB77789.1 hypothetical protein Oter_4518 [Opitutus terrae PB90-1]
MKLATLAQIGLTAALLPFAAFAQTTDQPAPLRTDAPTAADSFDRHKGDREFSIGGSGATNKDFDDSFGGVSFSYGSYLTDTLALVVRQSVNYSNPSTGGTQWNGSTKLALDQHVLANGPWRPFVGANFGRIYGDSVRDTWAAGLEAGVKYYVMPRTFIVAAAEYGWLFQHSRSVEDRFDDGQWNWSLGVGFNF